MKNSSHKQLKGSLNDFNLHQPKPTSKYGGNWEKSRGTVKDPQGDYEQLQLICRLQCYFQSRTMELITML